MKKSILASSIAAAVFGLGAVTGAQATVTASTTGAGNILLVPYFTAQAENATLLSLTNTDTLNGKVVKVRFRGAANSDDIFDFQVFLSPTDVWTANISKGADGKAKLTTSDASCTKPAASVLNATPFVTSRLNQALTGDALANGTREGYVEIIGMADIPKNATTGSGVAGLPTLSVANGGDATTNTLYTATKHVKSVAPCTGTAFTALDTAAWPLASGANGTAAALGLTPATGGLMANWTIINTTNSATWAGQATAFNATGTNVLYVPQTATAVTASNIAAWTADPLFLTGGSTGNVQLYNSTTQALGDASIAPIFAAGNYDLPDLSTPQDSAAYTTPDAQITAIQALLNKSSVVAEYMTDSAINGSTDWVFAMPSRRYSVAMAYAKASTTDDGRRFNKALITAGTVFNLANTSVVNGLICVSGSKIVPYDREENTPVSSTTVVVSPSTPGGQQLYCGEASVLAFNTGATSFTTAAPTVALKANVAVTGVEATYNAGWASLAVGYPILGGTFQKATNGAQGYGVFQAYR